MCDTTAIVSMPEVAKANRKPADWQSDKGAYQEYKIIDCRREADKTKKR